MTISSKTSMINTSSFLRILPLLIEADDLGLGMENIDAAEGGQEGIWEGSKG